MAALSVTGMYARFPLQPIIEQSVSVSNGKVRVGDRVRELPALHHIQPCACVLCLPAGSRQPSRVLGFGIRDGTVYLRLEHNYDCPAVEFERI